MRIKKLISLDFIFLYISVFLILWMILSNLSNNNVDTENAFTKRVRAGYEVRVYEGTIIGKEINQHKNLLFWKEVREIKADIESKGVKLAHYPFLIKKDNDGKKVFFFVKNGETTDFDDYIIDELKMETAFNSFMWYPTDKNQTKNYVLLRDVLLEQKVDFNAKNYWIEIYHPWYIIPFEMRNGVAVEINN